MRRAWAARQAGAREGARTCAVHESFITTALTAGRGLGRKGWPAIEEKAVERDRLCLRSAVQRQRQAATEATASLLLCCIQQAELTLDWLRRGAEKDNSKETGLRATQQQ